MEAAAIDGAGAVAAVPRRRRCPALKPILLILTALSVLWDFRVFTQIYVLQQAGGITRETNLLGVYAYRISIGANRLRHGRRRRHRHGADHAAAHAVYLRRCSARRSCDRDARADRARAAGAPPSPAQRACRNLRRPRSCS